MPEARSAKVDGLPASGNLVAGNHYITAAMVKIITANATPALLG